MEHLIEQANGGHEERHNIPRWPKNKCLKVRCILGNLEYYVPEGNAGPDPQSPPYHPFTIPECYSVVKIEDRGPIGPSKQVAIIKHTMVRLFQTGIETEVVDLPSWWDRRDTLVG